MDWWIEPFALGFQQRALIGGMLAAAAVDKRVFLKMI